MSFDLPKTDNLNKEERYQLILEQIKALTAGEDNLLANLANASALLFNLLPDLNWAGFYLLYAEELILGPFQGLPACIRIPVGKGVCGTAVKENRTIRVENVHEFPGHIACDAASNSEIVLPLRVKGEVVAVLDLDSPKLSRFDEIDQKYLELFVQHLENSAEFIIEYKPFA
ncbi:MAG: GAF domain-containing protein [Firmicutes bacterium]|nr:GAF domain-containing protein [Bacillota bacterium]